MNEERLRADLVLEYPFTRTTGPVIGAFMTGLREGIIIGIRRADGTVVVPPLEYDPTSADPLTELVTVGQAGVVESWTWVDPPREQSPWQQPHGLALIHLDGADTPLLHGVLVNSADAMSTGMRVVAKFRAEREGHISDIEGFVPEESVQ
ncbi:MAG: OB-fold domain-containing protein [Acidobacteria bacterium]|nr:OB-fold domain-containing protein [Acidobacteriota bacterium]